MTSTVIDEFTISPRVKELGVSIIGIQGDSYIVVYNDNTITTKINHDDDGGLIETIERFEKDAEPYIKDKLLIQNIISDISMGWYARNSQPETDGIKETGEDKKLEDELTAIYHFKSLKDTDEIYYWDEEQGIFIKNAEWKIKEECMKFDPAMRTKEVTEVINHIIWSNYTDRGVFDSQIEWIATGNCMLNLKTLETKPHSPDFMATVKIPHDYKPLPSDYHSLYCPCPKIMQFLYEVMGENAETVLDFMAYSLWRGLPFILYFPHEYD